MNIGTYERLENMVECVGLEAILTEYEKYGLEKWEADTIISLLFDAIYEKLGCNMDSFDSFCRQIIVNLEKEVEDYD